jgi:hypothetical protein
VRLGQHGLANQTDVLAQGEGLAGEARRGPDRCSGVLDPLLAIRCGDLADRPS